MPEVSCMFTILKKDERKGSKPGWTLATSASEKFSIWKSKPAGSGNNIKAVWDFQFA